MNNTVQQSSFDPLLSIMNTAAMEMISILTNRDTLTEDAASKLIPLCEHIILSVEQIRIQQDYDYNKNGLTGGIRYRKKRVS